MAKKNGRPFKLDEKQLKTLEDLAAIDCSYAEMSAIMGVDASNLTRSYAQVIQKGRQRGNASLKRKQFEIAQSGNVTMLIWLGKQRLDQSDKREDKIQAEVSTTEGSEVVELFKEVMRAKAQSYK